MSRSVSAVRLSTRAIEWRGDIRQVADVGRGAQPDGVHMEIRMTLQQTEPPTGTVQLVATTASEQGEMIAFTGWLGMLHALSALIESACGASTGVE